MRQGPLLEEGGRVEVAEDAGGATWRPVVWVAWREGKMGGMTYCGGGGGGGGVSSMGARASVTWLGTQIGTRHARGARGGRVGRTRGLEVVPPIGLGALMQMLRPSTRFVYPYPQRMSRPKVLRTEGTCDFVGRQGAIHLHCLGRGEMRPRSNAGGFLRSELGELAVVVAFPGEME